MLRKGSPKYAIFVLSVVVVSAAVLGIKNRLSRPSVASKDFAVTAEGTHTDERDALLQKVGKHILLDTTELPAVATVENAHLLRQKNLQFYKNAQNGDRVLVWSDKAILYSEERDIILAATFLPLEQSSPSSAVSTSTASLATSATSTSPAEENAVIEVRNGSGSVGRGRSVAETLKEAGLETLPATDAKARIPYEKTLISVASGKSFPETLTSILKAIPGELVELPPSEAPMKGDILIIVGKDYTP